MGSLHAAADPYSLGSLTCCAEVHAEGSTGLSITSCSDQALRPKARVRPEDHTGWFGMRIPKRSAVPCVLELDPGTSGRPPPAGNFGIRQRSSSRASALGKWSRRTTIRQARIGASANAERGPVGKAASPHASQPSPPVAGPFHGTGFIHDQLAEDGAMRPLRGRLEVTFHPRIRSRIDGLRRQLGSNWWLRISASRFHSWAAATP